MFNKFYKVAISAIIMMNYTLYIKADEYVSNDNKSLQINNVQITNINANGYTIEADVASKDEISRVAFPTWTTKNGQDDLIWLNGTVNEGHVTFRVDIKDHNFESGQYISHIYAYSNTGDLVVHPLDPVELKKGDLKIVNVQINKKTASGFCVDADVVSDYGLDKMQLATWTSKNGQDDLEWSNASLSNNHLTFNVDIKNHNYESGEYISHMYLYDKAGNLVIYRIDPIDVPNSIFNITNVNVTSISPSGYDIEADITSTNGIKNVAFPTWTTANGQDDLKWINGEVIGNKVKFHVSTKDHNYEAGEYNTHIYAYDNAGNLAISSISPVTLKKGTISFSIVQVHIINANGYDIEVEINSDYKLKRVAFPTWTTSQGQDDLTWTDGEILGNKAIIHIDTRDHNYESGEYNSHIYAYDEAGNLLVTKISDINISKGILEISDAQVIAVDSLGYTIQAKIISDYGIKKVSFPTWTDKNGQDDLKWADGTINGDIVTFRVNSKDHNYEDQTYNTHIYAYDNSGQMKVVALPSIMIANQAPTISDIKVSNITSWGYTITSTVKDDIEIDKVRVAVWTERNGQDDLRWYDATLSGDKAEVYVDIKNHNYEDGIYMAHIYAYDKGGKVSISKASNVSIKTSLTSGWNILNGKKYLINNQGSVVQGANKFIIDISEHNGDVDWEKVRGSGVDGVILRCGYGWDSSTNTQIDKRFIENAKELERLNIPYGVYLYSYESSVEGAKREAEYTLKLIKGRKISLPVYYDLEYDDYVGDLAPSMYTKMADAYCQIIKNAGYTPGIYANLDYWNTKLYDASLDKYEKWVAHFNTNDGSAGVCGYKKPYKMWQYTSKGEVSGVKGKVDLNARYD